MSRIGKVVIDRDKRNNNRAGGGWCNIEPDGPGNRQINIRDVKECASACGSHYFDPSTMRFFNSRVAEKAYADGTGGAYFTTSEKGPDNRRLYSVHRYDPRSCSIDTVGEFQGHKTMAAAQKAAAKLASGGGLSGRRRRR